MLNSILEIMDLIIRQNNLAEDKDDVYSAILQEIRDKVSAGVSVAADKGRSGQ